MMFSGRNYAISVMVLYACTLHIVWALILLVDEGAVGATAVDAIYYYIHNRWVLALSLFCTAIMAIIGLGRAHWSLILLLVPQQILLMMSAAGAIEAVWLGQFADGVVRSRAFLLADQAYSVIGAVGHTVSIIIHARRVLSTTGVLNAAGS